MTALSLDSIKPERRAIAQKILDGFAAAGFAQNQQVAALAIAVCESNLDPKAHAGGSEDSWGLFQLNRRGGLGTGRTAEELQDPDVNIGLIAEAAKKVAAFGSAASLDEAVSVFVRHIERPADAAGEIARAMTIGQRILNS